MHQSSTHERKPDAEGNMDPGPSLNPLAIYDSGQAKAGMQVITEFEYDVAGSSHAFQHWISCCMSTVGMHDLAVMDFLVLQALQRDARPKKLADICLLLNIEDTHIVGYALRKLVRLGTIQPDKHGKEVTYSTTSLGRDYLAHYQKIRENCLLDSLNTPGINKAVLKKLAQSLRKMSELYNQAARAASSLQER